MKCNICGCVFPTVIDKHYVARDNGKTGIAAIVTHDEENLYDAFDCPACGCQMIAQERKRKHEFANIDDEENEDD